MQEPGLGNPENTFVAQYHIDIFAPPDRVWDWLSRVELWSDWRQDVSSSHWLRSDGQDRRMKWRLRKLLGFTARVVSWQHERGMAWDAVSYGARISHAIRIEGDYRRTSVDLEVAGRGGLLNVYLLRGAFSQQLNRSNEIWLGALKAKLEAGKDDGIAPPPAGRDNPFINNVKLPSERTGFES
ncbi:MAG: SRPBCC family protein [Chloroflexi bacterium]|nr:SRPBCC family protein [Chloroflexota bacterium]